MIVYSPAGEKGYGEEYSIAKASTNTAVVIEPTTKKICDGVMKNVGVKAIVIGGPTPHFTILSGAVVGFVKKDLNKLYLKSKVAGLHGILEIEGTEII